MEIQNNQNLQSFILDQEISDEKAPNIKQIIGAFSEYIVAVNPDYVYNKTYLSAFVEEFILCQKFLRLKYQILKNKIIEMGIKDECKINIDGAWKYEKGKWKLNNSINPYYIRRDKMQIEIEFIHDNGFVVAEEINIAENCDDALNECISTFMSRRKELLDDKV